MPKTSPTDYKKVKPGSLVLGREGKSYTPSRGGINPKTGEYVKKGSLTQKPRGTFLEGVKTPKGDMKSAKTGKVIVGSKAAGPKELLTDRGIKLIQKKSPGPLSKIKAKIYALQGKTPSGNPMKNIYPLFKTTSTKGRIPKTRQVRPSTISPVTGKKIKKGGYGGGGTNTRGGSRGSGMKGGGGGAFLPGRTGFGEQ